MTKKVKAYIVPEDRVFPIAFEEGAKILEIVGQDGRVAIHFEEPVPELALDPVEWPTPLKTRYFKVVHIGEEIPDTAEYIGTALVRKATFNVLHVYEIKEEV